MTEVASRPPKAEVGLRKPEDEADLFRIYADLFGAEAAEANRTRWQWQYLDNPHAAGVPSVWVVRVDGRPVGQMATMPVALWWGEYEVRASWGMDFFVEPAAEGRGHGVALVRTWIASVDAALAAGLTPPAHALYRRLGFTDLASIPFYQVPLDGAAIVGRRTGRVVGRVAGPIVDMAMRAHRKFYRRPDRGVEIRAVAHIGPEYDDLWTRARPEAGVCVRRDAAYVRWKYQQAPHVHYDIVEARRGGELCGFAVGRHHDYRGTKLGWIVDVFVARGDDGARDALVNAHLGRMRAAGVARVEAIASHTGLGAELWRHGFFRGASRKKLCVRAPGLPPALLADLGAWHVVFGDGDMAR